MNRYVFPLFALTGAALLPASLSAAEVTIQATNPVIELNVTEMARAAPDVAMINAGVQTRAATAREAIEQNGEAMDRLIARLRSLGIERKDIQTSSFNLNPDYQYNPQTGEQTFKGYNVNNSVSVTLRDLDQAGDILDAMVDAGANNVYGPNFMLEDDAAIKEEARETAFARGMAQAQSYARLAGYSGVRILEISENFSGYGPVPPPPPAMARAESVQVTGTRIEPGEVGVNVNLLIKYEMTR
ncbi:DUF541 domain-containing protein [Altererythrobacter aurantiacus]|uniref:DUF541 domain-containing protein n=1 Tax=Parapontixanthobacter aurantiacus TaxID=1463599 RepID=A0A844ZDC2_9SPHN|nr:SIMPL domain-containing protein [Parapontixanthobacter aurantiacus]MXO84930.1 DUF541 domain-containing protein [Parapontixanthobacter aurantiacus]